MSDLAEVFPGPGEMACLMRAHDWERSGLGHPCGWPRELRTCVQVCLESRFPIVLWWGEDLRLLYNDAWRPALGALGHPAIDRPGREVWSEIWHIIGPQLAGVMETGEATWSTDMLLPMDRSGYLEETYWTYSHSPIRDDARNVCGVFTPVAETTRRVVSARRLRMLRRLGEVATGPSMADTCRQAIDVIGGEPTDIPFARIYLADGGVAREAAATAGVPADVPTDRVELHGTGGRWPWASVRETGAPALVHLDGASGARDGDWGPARLASVHALTSPTGDDPIGYLVAGISPARAYDDAYRDFLARVARHSATLVANAAASDDERRRARTAAELDRAKSTFVSNVGHEFRIPLTLLPAPLEEVRDASAAVSGEPLEAGADDDLGRPSSAHELPARVNAHRALGDAREAAVRDRLLADASLALDATIGVGRRLRAVASLLTGALADLCVIYLQDEDGELRRAAVSHTDPAALEALRAIPGPSARMRRIVREGRSELIGEVTDEDLREWEGEAGDLDRRRRIAPRSFCGVPVIVRGTTIGAIALGRSSASDPLTPAHLRLAEELGRRIGLAVDNARLYEGAQRSARVEADRAQALAELQNLTAALSEALTPSAVAGALIDIGLPLVGGVAGGLMVIDDDARVLRSVRLGGYPAGSADREWRIPLAERTPLTDAVRHRAIRYVESSDEAVRRWPSMEGFRAAHALDGALAAVPIVSGSRALGALAVRYPAAGPLGGDARRLLETVARLAGPALLRSSHYILQHSVAETLQRSLLPLRLPAPAGLSIAAGYTAAGEGIEAGGDWYDAIELPGGRLALMVGDVVGRGPRAAAVMGQLRSALRAFASDRRDGPGDIVANLSRFASTIDGADVSTACYAELDLAGRRLRYVCAGHPPPLVLTADGGTRYLEGGRGVPLGVREHGEAYAEGEARIPAGATVVLYTDGLVERRGQNIDVGFGALAAAAARLRSEAPSDVTDGILAELGGSGDDCALLICRLDPPAGTLVVEVGADARELRVVRAELREWLAGLGVPPTDVEDVILASGEALANSVEHGHGSRGVGAVRLSAAMDATRSTLDVEVVDDGRWRPPPAERGDRGRGFPLMRALMEGVEVEHDDRGTRVAMRRRLHPDRIPPSPLPARLRAGDDAASDPTGSVLRLQGDIDASIAATVMHDLTEQDSRVRTVDLTGVAVLGSAAIQLLFGAARRLRDRGGTLEIIAAPGSLSHRLLELTDLGSLCAVRAPGAGPTDS